MNQMNNTLTAGVETRSAEKAARKSYATPYFEGNWYDHAISMGVHHLSLVEFFHEMELDYQADKAATYIVALLVKENNSDKDRPFNEIRKSLLELRYWMSKQLSAKYGESLLVDKFRRQVSEELTSMVKEYYKLCKKNQAEYVNALINELKAFSVRDNAYVEL